ncbi:MAG TPA: phosphoribosylamine--glycine ligase [Actinomycetaceae bacterium]|nr:phosphoribosylamine--glycine ligase [Actinomycetaceae bacterium]
MKVLLLGSGGREHALARSLTSDPKVASLWTAPGNSGTAALGTNLGLDPCDPGAVATWASDNQIDLVIVGPEAPLVAGVADAVAARGIPVFGPTKAAARLEESKSFAKEIMEAVAVPTAKCRVVTTREGVSAAMDEFGAPYVIKFDGLAAGKGVAVTSDRDAALAHAGVALSSDGAAIVVEEFLDGPEVSLFCLCDGTNVVPLAPAQDFKRAYDDDEGPNTGGMGAYSPLPWAPPGLTTEVLETVAVPVVREMARRGTPFVGVLYCGLALTSKGVKVIEFNVRFGDPEAQVVLPRLRTPLAGVLLAAAEGRLDEVGELEWSDGAALTVVVAAEGYPTLAMTGGEVTGVEEAEDLEGVHVIHAGLRAADGGLVAAGGRVLCVVGEGTDLGEARDRAYQGVARISLRGSHHRRDIGSLAAGGGIRVGSDGAGPGDKRRAE